MSFYKKREKLLRLVPLKQFFFFTNSLYTSDRQVYSSEPIMKSNFKTLEKETCSYAPNMFFWKFEHLSFLRQVFFTTTKAGVAQNDTTAMLAVMTPLLLAKTAPLLYAI